jgi:sec-independent protein translocase protein TatA
MSSLELLTGFLPNLQGPEILVILVIGILLFGKRLPEVGRSLGKGIVEFKKGLRGVEDDVDAAADRPAARRTDDRIDVDSPKFELPPTGDRARQA